MRFSSYLAVSVSGHGPPPLAHKHKKHIPPPPPERTSRSPLVLAAAAVLLLLAVVAIVRLSRNEAPTAYTEAQPAATRQAPADSAQLWIERARAVSRKFHEVYTPCWEGAYGAIGDAYLFAATHDSSIMRFHIMDHPLQAMCTGNWVDDRAWVCLAELLWWRVTDRQFDGLVTDARRRYDQARKEGRLATIEGFWSWYTWPPNAVVDEKVFTNSNMNQMATVAVELYEATGIHSYFEDALLVWNGDRRFPGVVKTLYKGNGVWEGRQGLAAYGKQLPWEGTEYCSLAGALYRVTHDRTTKDILTATAAHILNPATGWVDPVDFYQIRMDGNGAFVNYLLDAYAVAPDDLPQVLPDVERMLTHVWTNHAGRAVVTLHRESDDGIRNGWNPSGGEDGYGVDEVGTVHAQGEAARAFGTFAYYLVRHRDTTSATGGRSILN